jgi:hypothetical protein
MALRKDESISLSITQSLGYIQNAKRIGYVYKIEPEGTIFSVPAKLILPYGYVTDINEDRLSIYYWDKFQEKWLRSGGYVDKNNKTVYAEVNYLSYFAIMQEEGEPEKHDTNQLDVKLSPNAYFAPDINRLTIYYNAKWKFDQAINVSIEIYDMGGNLVRELISDSAVFSGWNTAQWDGKNESGKIVSNGRYFVVVTAESGGDKISKTKHLAVFR